MHDRDSLVAVSSLPYPFQPIFNFRYFNSVQSESFSEAYLSDENMVVSAPTGSGKTVLFELCILRLLNRSIAPDGQFNHVRGAHKIVYIAPIKALVQEKYRDWNKKFGQILRLGCQELTGDSHILKVSDMQDTDIILTTPEKFDSITRHHRDHGGVGFFGDIALLLIDEVHLLNDSRGAALEAVVSRMKMLSSYPELRGCPIARIRFIAVSATIPNIEDLGYAAAKNDFLFEKRLQNYLYDVIVQHSEGKPALVFCCTRKGAQDAALVLADTVSKPGTRSPFIKSQQQLERLSLAATSGYHLLVAYHNGGVDAADRALVEGLFLKGDLQVLCTTSTLAHGVNLPAHLVVIKSTQFFDKERRRYVEHERSTLLQMCGRAGRPQFDDSGVVVLMTRKETVPLYENLLSGSEPVESQLLPSIAEHLNAEIALMTVSDVSLAIDWLKCSYLYVRIRKQPQRYKIEKVITEEQMEKHMKEICLHSVNELVKYGMVHMDEYGFTLKPLEPGRLMAKYYLNFQTMKTITEIPERAAMDELLRALGKAQELSWIHLRRHEKKLLNTINQDNSGRIRFHILGSNGKIKKRIQTNDEKVFLLLNDALSAEPAAVDFTMTQDVNDICRNGTRISRCMGEYFKFMKRYRETKNALLLAKCLRQRLWEDSPHQLKQLPGIGMITVKAFHAAGIDSFDKLANADARHLESITGRRFPYGDQVKDCLTGLPPKVHLLVRETGFRVGCKNEYILELTRITQTKTTHKWHMADLIVGDECENQILFHERIRLDQFSSPYPVGVFSTNSISVALICEEHVGMDILNSLAHSSNTNTSMESNGDGMDAQQRGKMLQSVGKKSLRVSRLTQEPSLGLERLLGNSEVKKEEYLPHQMYCRPPLHISRSSAVMVAAKRNDLENKVGGVADYPTMKASNAEDYDYARRSIITKRQVRSGADRNDVKLNDETEALNNIPGPYHEGTKSPRIVRGLGSYHTGSIDESRRQDRKPDHASMFMHRNVIDSPSRACSPPPLLRNGNDINRGCNAEYVSYISSCAPITDPHESDRKPAQETVGGAEETVSGSPYEGEVEPLCSAYSNSGRYITAADSLELLKREQLPNVNTVTSNDMEPKVAARNDTQGVVCDTQKFRTGQFQETADSSFDAGTRVVFSNGDEEEVRKWRNSNMYPAANISMHCDVPYSSYPTHMPESLVPHPGQKRPAEFAQGQTKGSLLGDFLGSTDDCHDNVQGGSLFSFLFD